MLTRPALALLFALPLAGQGSCLWLGPDGGWPGLSALRWRDFQALAHHVEVVPTAQGPAVWVLLGSQTGRPVYNLTDWPYGPCHGGRLQVLAWAWYDPGAWAPYVALAGWRSGAMWRSALTDLRSRPVGWASQPGGLLLDPLAGNSLGVLRFDSQGWRVGEPYVTGLLIAPESWRWW